MKQRRLIPVVLLLIFVMFMLVSPALAHERRELGEHLLVFGWRVEPALSGQVNGPELYVYIAKADTPSADRVPVTEAELAAEISFGDATMNVTLRPAFNQPGHYIADLIPTLPGDYSFHVTGMIGEVAVDEVFTSADGMFGTVEPVTDVMFPEPEPSALDLMARIEALEQMVADLQSK